MAGFRWHRFVCEQLLVGGEHIPREKRLYMALTGPRWAARAANMLAVVLSFILLAVANIRVWGLQGRDFVV